MARLQTLDSDLSVADHLLLIELFEENVAAADSYVNIDDTPLCRGWCALKIASRQLASKEY